MDKAQAQERVYRLVTLATDQPDTPEGQNAAMAACRLIREEGLLIMTPADLLPQNHALSPSPSTKKKRKRPNAKAIAQEAASAADTLVTGLDAAGRVVAAFNGFSQVLRRGG